MVAVSHAFITQCVVGMMALSVFLITLQRETNPGTVHIIQDFTITYAYLKTSVTCHRKVL